MELQRKRQKLPAKEEDRISDLPDHLIHHILSFLPSTKQVIQTGILSKRWRKQWIHVPFLVFDRPARMTFERFLNVVESTLVLHNCSKIKKFHLQYPYSKRHDPHFHDKILFATRKHVQELYLDSAVLELLPKLFFSTASSLIKLTALGCSFTPNGTVNWGSLTALHLERCKLTGQALGHILSGTPLLKSLELNKYEFDNLVIVSKSLKRLVLGEDNGNVLEISCPNLLEFSITNVFLHNPKVFAQVIDKVLSTSLSLESFELKDIVCAKLNLLVIASTSLKRLVLRLNYIYIRNIQASCPQLQELELRGCFKVGCLKLLNLPSSLCATLDVYNWEYEETSIYESWKLLVQDILHQLHHVKELIFGSSFIQCLLAFKDRALFPFVLNIESLTLNSPDLIQHCSGIACVLPNAPVLEKLVINMEQQHNGNFKHSRENFRNSNYPTIFNGLLHQLKTIEITGFPQRYYDRNMMVYFIQFLLKNANVLEKMVIVIKGERENLPLRFSYQLLHLPRCSKDAIIELLYS